MAFSCPKCGSTTFKVASDGLRECTGQLVFSRTVRMGKPEFAPPDAPKIEPPIVKQAHSVRCPVWWEAQDDGKYGVVVDEVSNSDGG